MADIEKVNKGFTAAVLQMIQDGREGLDGQPLGPVRQIAGTLLALDLLLQGRELRQLQSKFMVPRRTARRIQVG